MYSEYFSEVFVNLVYDMYTMNHDYKYSVNGNNINPKLGLPTFRLINTLVYDAIIRVSFVYEFITENPSFALDTYRVLVKTIDEKKSVGTVNLQRVLYWI